MTIRKKQNHWLRLKSQLSYDETILSAQATYRPYKRASNFRGSSSLELNQRQHGISPISGKMVQHIFR
jgi:hypothetical protein